MVYFLLGVMTLVIAGLVYQLAKLQERVADLRRHQIADDCNLSSELIRTFDGALADNVRTSAAIERAFLARMDAIERILAVETRGRMDAWKMHEDRITDIERGLQQQTALFTTYEA